MVRPPFMNAPGPEPAEMVKGIAEIRTAAPEFLLRIRQQYGPVAQFPIPKPLTYLVSDPEVVDQVLRTNAKSFGKATIQYRTLALVTGFGLLAADTPTWRAQRPIVQPAFHHDLVAGVVDHSVVATKDVIASLEQQLTNTVDVDHEMMSLALNVVGTALFGSDFRAGADNVISATLAGLDVVISRARTPIFPPSWLPTPMNVKLKRAKRTLTRAVDQVIETATSRPEQQTIANLLVAEMAAGNLTKSQVRDELVTFIVAGHETVASALSWSLHLLSQNPEIQEAIADEVKQVLGNRDPVFADYHKLNYTKAVFNETMRLYPPAWVLTRNALADVELAGYHIAAGSLVVISPWVVHRDQSVWPDPETFNPARFDAEKRIMPGAYIPFGLGNRMCIGKDFAMFEGVIALAMLVRQFRFEPTEAEVKPLPSVTVRPKSGLHLQLRHR